MFNFLTYPLRAWHRRGFDVQSPWAFELVCDVFFTQHSYYAIDKLNQLRETVPPSAHDNILKDDELLFRIANHFHPKHAVEIGSQLSATYIVSPHADTTCKVFAADDSTETIISHISQNKPVDLLHIATPVNLGFYQQIEQHMEDLSILVINDIHGKNRKVWKHIVDTDERASVTFDLLRCGIVTFDPKRVKQNYLL